MSSYRDIKQGSEPDLQVAVGTVGPISVAIDASSLSYQVVPYYHNVIMTAAKYSVCMLLQLYNSGVYYEHKCSETMLDHAVLAVGYGSDGGQEYWLIKNRCIAIVEFI